MHINLKRLALLPGQTKEVIQECEGAAELLEGMQAAFTGKMTVKLQIEHTGRCWMLRGSLQVPLLLACSRCLESFAYRAEGSFTRIAVADAATFSSYAASAEQDDYLLVKDGCVDLTQAIEEALVLGLPMVSLCRENCSGLCDVCGQNLNLGTCHCRDDVIDPRLEKLKLLLK